MPVTSKTITVTVLVLVAVALGLISATLFLTPEEAHPAYAVAVAFVSAAARGEEDTAHPLLSAALQDYVRANCPQGRVSGCIQSYTPADWGGLLAAEFRRAIPDGDAAFDILLVATYAEYTGFSGVCIYQRVEETAAGRWQVAGWSGFIHCGEPNAGLQQLRTSDAPNRVP